MTNSPPERGIDAETSASESAPHAAIRPPTAQTRIAPAWLPVSATTNPAVPRMPPPTVLETTRNAAVLGEKPPVGLFTAAPGALRSSRCHLGTSDGRTGTGGGGGSSDRGLSKGGSPAPEGSAAGKSEGVELIDEGATCTLALSIVSRPSFL